MSTFDQREESFEKRFAHDEELQFRAEARRNKLLGLWAAEKLGKTGADAQAYVDKLVAAEVAAGRLPAGEDTERRSAYLARMLLSLMSSPAGYDLDDPLVVADVVDQELLVGFVDH